MKKAQPQEPRLFQKEKQGEYFDGLRKEIS